MKKPAKKKGKTQKERPKLNQRQERFCELVVAGRPATQAYIEAGYKVSTKAAEASASRLLRNVKAKQKISELSEPRTEQALLKKEDNLRWLAGCITTPINQIDGNSPFVTEYSQEQIAGGRQGQLKRGQAPSGNEKNDPPIIRTKIKKCDPLRAIEIYSKLRGHFEPDRIEVDLGEKTILSIKERAMQMASPLARKA